MLVYVSIKNKIPSAEYLALMTNLVFTFFSFSFLFLYEIGILALNSSVFKLFILLVARLYQMIVFY